jgi:hypothetical protein
VTDAVGTGLVRESLYSGTGALLATGIVREVLRTTGTGGATFLNIDGVIREVLRSQAAAISGAKAIVVVLG